MNESSVVKVDTENIAPSLEREFDQLGFSYRILLKSAIRHSDQTFHLIHIEEPLNTKDLKDEIVFEFRTHCLVPGIPDQIDAMTCKYVRFKADTQRIEELISMKFYKVNKPWPNKEQICFSLLQSAKLHTIKNKFGCQNDQPRQKKAIGKRI